MEPQDNQSQNITPSSTPTPAVMAPQSTTPPSQPTTTNGQSDKKHLAAIIILTIVALCGIAFGIIGMVLYSNSNTTIEQLQKQIYELSAQKTDDIQASNTNNQFDDIYGYWLTKNGTYFQFDNEEFHWWKSKEDLFDNYYSGRLEIYQGTDAADVLDTSYDKLLDVTTISDGKISINNIYALKLYPTYLISGGIDKTNTLATNFPEGDDYMLLSFIIIDEDEAQAYNYNSGDTYYLTKDAE